VSIFLLQVHFTVVWWEQRGSGISFNASIPPEMMTLEQMISDTLEMTNYLRRRFSQEKIYLMGHLGGTFIGIQGTCSFTEAKSYFEQLKAPLKGFYTFKHSAQSPLFEEPEKMQRILREDVLAGVNNLADAKEMV
jgi:predicted alpha/beta-fold hydrolase